MGNHSTNPARSTINKNNFAFEYIIGKGGFSKVWRVKLKKTKQVMALKEMSKLRIISKHSVASVMNERRLLSNLRHPFIVNMKYAFQDVENLYLVMDLMTGGDLRFHIGRHKQFTEKQTQFFVACIVTALEYVHLNGVIHRDLKPENLVLDGKGYIRLTDFGIARRCSESNSDDASGTPGYMAPEVLCKQSHGPLVDYFALGVLTYECMKSSRPYRGRDKREYRDTILARQVQLKRGDIPEGWSLEAGDFINKLLQRKPAMRLGAGGAKEVKNHAWLRDFPWKQLFEKSLVSPFIPPSSDENFDSRVQLNWREEFELDTKSLEDLQARNLFEGYYFNDSSHPLT